MFEVIVYLAFVVCLILYIRSNNKNPNLWAEALERISFQEYGKENCIKWRSEKNDIHI